MPNDTLGLDGHDVTPKNESQAIAPTNAEPKLDEATKPQYGDDPAPVKAMTLADLQAAVEHEPDDSRAVELAANALLSNPLELMFEIMDEEAAENARAPCCASRASWEKAFAEFARSERIDSSTSFKYAKLSRAQPCEFKRERKLLAARPWVDFGRNWVYTVQPMRGDPTLWVPQGREYRPVGCDQFSAGPYPYEAEASIAWRFSKRDLLTIEGVWPRTPGYLYNDPQAPNAGRWADPFYLRQSRDPPARRRIEWALNRTRRGAAQDRLAA